MTARRPPSFLPDFVREALDADDPASERATFDVLGAIGMASLVAEAEPAGRQRLLDAVRSGPARYAPFYAKLERFFDLERDAIVRLLGRTGSDASWISGPMPGIFLFDVDGGPALGEADAGLVRLPAGLVLPHTHLGDERVLVLEGAYRDESGRLYRPGDLHEMAAGTSHCITVLPEGPLLQAIILADRVIIPSPDGGPDLVIGGHS